MLRRRRSELAGILIIVVFVIIIITIITIIIIIIISSSSRRGGGGGGCGGGSRSSGRILKIAVLLWFLRHSACFLADWWLSRQNCTVASGSILHVATQHDVSLTAFEFEDPSLDDCPYSVERP